MAEPNTPNVALVVPNTGDLVDTWGIAAVNPDFVAIDGMLGGTLTLALSAPTTTVLTLPTGSISPAAGPTQSQNACINVTGTVTGNQVIQLGMPGRYIFGNQCLPLIFSVVVSSVGGGRQVGLPPGQRVTVYHDGTNVDFVDTVPVGASLDLCGVTTMPVWITACTVQPYLLKDGTIYNISAYPILGNLLGSTFGGDGVTTFGVPDELARVRAGYDTVGTGRLITNPDATIMGDGGGVEFVTLTIGEIPSHTHTVIDPGHTHTLSQVVAIVAGFAAGVSNGYLNTTGTPVTAQGHLTNVTIAAAGGGGNHYNIQPTTISTFNLIKT